MKDLPKYKITIDPEYSQDGEDLGISMIAFTSKPAIITKGFAFSAHEPKQLFFADDLKYRICAPVMIPMDIYRLDDDEEYYVQFSAEEIELMHKKFMSKYNSGSNVFNLEHDTEDVVPAYILEATLVDTPTKQSMFSTDYNIDVPLGTLMMTSQITDIQAYNNLVENKQTGYSIEGFLGLKLSEIKQKFNNMNDQILNLPAGEYTDKDGKVFVVAEDGTCTVKETMAAELPPVEPNPGDTSEEDKKKKDPNAPAETTPPTETAPVVDSYTKEEVDAKFEEIFKIIADMQAEDDTEDQGAPVPNQEQKMSAAQRFEEFVRFSASK